jgi:dihydrofolate reductase
MIITCIVAISSNYGIGKNNQLLWDLPNDSKHFIDIISGNTIVMGRKLDSIKKPIANCRNIIITRQAIEIEGCEVVSSLEAAIALCSDEQEVFIVGGAEIYRQAMHICNRIYLTIVHHAFEADTFFPKIDYNEWQQTAIEDHEIDEKHAFAYSFITLERA